MNTFENYDHPSDILTELERVKRNVTRLTRFDNDWTGFAYRGKPEFRAIVHNNSRGFRLMLFRLAQSDSFGSLGMPLEHREALVKVHRGQVELARSTGSEFPHIFDEVELGPEMVFHFTREFGGVQVVGRGVGGSVFATAIASPQHVRSLEQIHMLQPLDPAEKHDLLEKFIHFHAG